MAKMDRCPICQVAVKPENLPRHLSDIHPRHPDTAALAERLKEEGRSATRRTAGPPFRIRKWHVGAVLAVGVIILVGVVAVPYFDPSRGFTRDSCITSEVFHLHPYMRIWALDHYHPIPGNIGVSSTCIRPLHTHGGYDPSTGWVQLHVEGPFAKDFTLGDFFYIWGEPFSSTQVSTFVEDETNRVTMLVDEGNGFVQSTAFGSLALRDGQRIEIRYGP